MLIPPKSRGPSGFCLGYPTTASVRSIPPVCVTKFSTIPATRSEKSTYHHQRNHLGFWILRHNALGRRPLAVASAGFPGSLQDPPNGFLRKLR